MSIAKADDPIVAKKATSRYVTVPDTDLFDQPHPPIRVNEKSFGPGTHFIENELANTVEERLRVYARANVRILQPKRDIESENLMSKGQGVATTQF